MAESNDSVSKREVQSYMQKQQEQKSDSSSAFAIAWNKANNK
jgi:hypothetical protein